MPAFVPKSATVSLAVTPSSANVQVTSAPLAAGRVWRIANAGPNKVFLAFGPTAPTATTSGMILPANAVDYLCPPEDSQFIAAIAAATESGAITVTPGYLA